LTTLRELVTANTVLGKPVDMGDKVVIPVAGFGFGFGTGEGRNSEKGSSGVGGGAGAGITPVAVIVVTLLPALTRLLLPMVMLPVITVTPTS
jgi:uncharacterized spore protein YtfJ